MADNNTSSEATTDSTKSDQVAQLKGYLKTIMAKQEELKQALALKHDKAKAARRLSQHLGGTSVRHVIVDADDGSHSIDVVETPGMEKRLENYADSVDQLEKELEETTKLVNEVATALAVLGAQQA